MIKISIIIPVYQVEQYIEACLNSVASQTMTKELECLVVDDCGSDGSLDIAKRFIASYCGNIKFRLIQRECNGGLSAARNSGINEARGEYVYFLDSDDAITSGCMEEMWSLVDKYGSVDLVQSTSTEEESELDKKGPYSFPQYTTDSKLIKNFLLTYNGDIIGAQGRLVKTSLIKSNKLFFKEGIIHEDNYWSFFLAKFVKSMAFDNHKTYFHRYNPSSITNNVNVAKEAFSYKIIINDFSHNIDSFLSGRQKELTLCNLLTSFAYLNANERKEMVRIFMHSNGMLEKLLLFCYLNMCGKYLKNKLLHLLIRLYKIYD